MRNQSSRSPPRRLRPLPHSAKAPAETTTEAAPESPTAPPAHAPAPKASQSPSRAPKAVAPSWPSSYRSLIGIGSGIGTIAGVERAVRIAQTPSTTGHGTHPTRSCSIKAWHLVHLLPIRHQYGIGHSFWHDLALSPSPSTSTSTPAPSQSPAKPWGGKRRKACRGNGWLSVGIPHTWTGRQGRLYRSACQSRVSVGSLPCSRRGERDGAVALPSSSHGAESLRPGSIKSWHVAHLLSPNILVPILTMLAPSSRATR